MVPDSAAEAALADFGQFVLAVAESRQIETAQTETSSAPCQLGQQEFVPRCFLAAEELA